MLCEVELRPLEVTLWLLVLGMEFLGTSLHVTNERYSPFDCPKRKEKKFIKRAKMEYSIVTFKPKKLFQVIGLPLFYSNFVTTTNRKRKKT